MALITGARNTYGYDNSSTTTDGANEAIDISGALSTLNPFHHPLLLRIGTDSLQSPAEQVKHEWLEDEAAGLSTTSTDTDLNNTSTGSVVLTVASGEGLKFRGGTVASASADIIRISSTAGEELAPVTASASTTVTCTRGAFTGSSPVDHTGYTKTLTIVGRYQPQGLTSVGTSITTLKANKYNYTQIFEDSYTQSATQRVTKKFTQQDDRAYEMGKQVDKMATWMERTLLFGYRTAPASASTGGTMQGIRATISTNSYSKSGAALTQTMLEQALVDIYNAGGDGMFLVLVSDVQQRRINTFMDAYRMVGYTDSVLGNYVDRFRSRFGTMDIVLDKNIPSDEVLILTTSNIGFGPLRGRALGTSPIPQTSRESQTWETTGEYTCEVRLEKTHARIYGLATTGIF